MLAVGRVRQQESRPSTSAAASASSAGNAAAQQASSCTHYVSVCACARAHTHTHTHTHTHAHTHTHSPPQDLVGPGAPTFVQQKPVERLPSGYVARAITFTHLAMLDNYVTDAGRLQPRRRTGLSRKVQSQVARQVKVCPWLMLLAPCYILYHV